MEHSDKNIHLLNSLITINNDRIEGYEKAASETEENDLKLLFNNMADESRTHRSELISAVISKGGTPAEGTTTTGKMYRAWMDIKSALTGKDRHAIISSCEYGEDAALETYADVLKDSELSSDVKQIAEKQRNSIKASHDRIKQLRDAAAAI